VTGSDAAAIHQACSTGKYLRTADRRAGRHFFLAYQRTKKYFLLRIARLRRSIDRLNGKIQQPEVHRP
jgi:hypothetical protein